MSHKYDSTSSRIFTFYFFSVVGETVNLMSVDALRFRGFVFHINSVQNAIVIVGLTNYFLWGYLGPSCLAGSAVLVLMVPILSLCFYKIKSHNMRMMEVKDQRMKVLSEVIEGVKVIKFNAWEDAFSDRIQVKR